MKNFPAGQGEKPPSLQELFYQLEQASYHEQFAIQSGLAGVRLALEQTPFYQQLLSLLRDNPQRRHETVVHLEFYIQLQRFKIVSGRDTRDLSIALYILALTDIDPDCIAFLITDVQVDTLGLYWTTLAVQALKATLEGDNK